jgi:molecular chaperone GrpE (heat shock protein)
MSFDPYQKLAQIVENVNTRSAEGEEGAETQTNAPSFFDLEKRNKYLEENILSLEAQLRRTEEALIRKSDDYDMMKRLYQSERKENIALMSDGMEQDEYTAEILLTKH